MGSSRLPILICSSVRVDITTKLDWLEVPLHCPEFNVQVRQESHRQNLDPLWHPWISCTWDYPGSSWVLHNIFDINILQKYELILLSVIYGLTFPRLEVTTRQLTGGLLESFFTKCSSAIRHSLIQILLVSMRRSSWTRWGNYYALTTKTSTFTIAVLPLILPIFTTRLFGLAIRSTPSQGT